jgi:branched-chain amino acid transport system permease protein
MHIGADRLATLAFVLALAGVPLAAPPFWVTLGNYIGLYSIVALGLVLLTGVAGQTSFGQAAFVGLGAYTTAYLTTRYGTSPWLALPAGLAITLVVALALGFITLRMRGHYLPLATIAWGLSLFFVFGNLDWLGGHSGMSGIPALTFAGVDLKDERASYLLIWAIALAALWTTHNLLDSRTGRALRALKGGLEMAEAFGVNAARLKIIAFVYAALLACVSGWLYAHL